ncbi:MAG: hypothetical protein Q4F35_08160, partial [Akkermansia sp.]|nr:hypothetical protein [Akkermansia sp.]
YHPKKFDFRSGRSRVAPHMRGKVGLFCRMVAHMAFSISTAKRMEKPAFSKPLSNPMAPEKVDMVGYIS